MRTQTFAFKSAELLFFDSADSTNNTETKDVTDIGNVKGLTIANTGALQFSTTDAIYTGLGANESRQIKAIYDVTSGGTTASNEFIINIASDGSNQTVDFRSTRILGQLTAADVDRETTLTYEQVGAPIDGLSIHGSTGAWELDASAPAYQELTAGETKTITVTYAVRDEEGATSQKSFDIELTGTNDNPLLTGTATTLPGGSEDTAYVVTKDQLLAGYTDADDGETDNLTIGDLLGKDSNGASAGTFAPDDANNPTKWTFTPVAHFNGTVNVTYNVIDVKQGTTAATSEFDLASVNDIPTLTGTKTNFTTHAISLERKTLSTALVSNSCLLDIPMLTTTRCRFWVFQRRMV